MAQRSALKDNTGKLTAKEVKGNTLYKLINANGSAEKFYLNFENVEYYNVYCKK